MLLYSRNWVEELFIWKALSVGFADTSPKVRGRVLTLGGVCGIIIQICIESEFEVKMSLRKISKLFSTFQIIILSFAVLILLGTLLLSLPIATASGKSAGFMTSFFTATSAVCVTGLIVQDTATFWSSFGHTVIICLIQIGGLGVVTAAITAVMLSGKKIGLMQRSTMQEAIAAPKLGGIVSLTGFILKTSLGIELVGAILMLPAFCREFGFKGIWYSVFHAISAFCNAGFDLMGVKEPFSSLTSFSASFNVNIVIMLLIIIGGLGFLTWEDILKHRHHIKKYRLQSKAILAVTAILVAFPAVYFYFAELSYLSGAERVLTSVFQSVTLRTAGFNTVNFAHLSETGIALMIAVMLVGGASGSTAGGMKTNTVAVLFASVRASFGRKKSAYMFGRRIPDDAVQNALAILVMYITLFMGGAMIISALEGLPLVSCMFETASAVATVGLSMGITGELGVISQLILIALMYFGRVGGLTLIYAALHSKNTVSSLPEEKIAIG